MSDKAEIMRGVIDMDGNTIKNNVRDMLTKYIDPSVSMDPIYFEIIRQIDDDFIGLDEDGEGSDVVIRNNARSIQRRVLHSEGDDSLMIPIGFYLDTFKRSLTTSTDDEIIHWDIDKTTHAIIDSIEKYLAIRGRNVVGQQLQNDTEKALEPLFQRQLERLGVL